MKLHTGLVFAACASLGLISYACVNGDTVQNGSTGTGGSTSGATGGSSSGQTGGNGSSTGGSTGSGTGGSSSHTGGNTGSGGNVSSTGGNGTGGNGSGTGGSSSTGTGGSSSTGTGGNSSVSICTQGATFKPMNALITDFSDAVASSAGNYNFGSMKGMLGGTSLFSDSTNGTLSTGTGGLTFKGSVPAPTTADMYPYTGFVVFMNGPACVDASTYTGISFTISGSGGCTVQFGFGDKEHTAATSDAMRGTCTSTCYAAGYSLTVSASPTTVKMPFAGTPTSDGSPKVAVDSMNITGVQWQFGQTATATSSCMETLTVTNISFY